ncbi:thioredoxin reductase [Anseongella ginsenosidimutans]|uniref:Thioredoxin reductase n=1 Tax=Anseongella ginsenosidimutans TaxID=496056 RepID=A0A4R3KSE7_9SPHI|nr:NAD(P)/FAD-dependent oxidoreductase [Anseongella ginsenosidimutans]QEC53080.1 NAD(P)/FAD-dependent oxidoreductase [Anseongella ginsenosidimutans]TCS87696.1 thioredoxin reductase [Anseongella ginsenosidimutans]
MTTDKDFDIIIIGGSYAGLSAAMALGRSLRKVLIIDSGQPCNKQTPHSHNFITGDGERPAAIAVKAREQVLNYETVTFQPGLVTEGSGKNNAFEIKTGEGLRFSARKLLFATGLKDIPPPVEGFAECWGISVLHCPYCHGYEVRGERTGILANGDMAVDFARLISNWTSDLTVFTNGNSGLSEEQSAIIAAAGVRVIEKEILRIEHEAGKIGQLVFTDGSKEPVTALYARPGFTQHCPVPELLGCELTEQGFIKVDEMKRTTIPGVYAAGDNTSPMRALSTAIAAGTMAGAALNKEWIDQRF